MKTSEKIKLIRTMSKQTQTQFGESLGISKATVSNYEIGRVPFPPSLVILTKLLYNIDPEWLLDDSREDIREMYFDKNKGQNCNIPLSVMQKLEELKAPFDKVIISAIEQLYDYQTEQEKACSGSSNHSS